MEEAFNMPKEKIKDLMCEFVEAEILKMKMEENPNNTTVDEKNKPFTKKCWHSTIVCICKK